MGSRSIKNRPSVKKKSALGGALSVLGVIAVLFVAGGVAAFALINAWLVDLPDYQDADEYNTAQPTVVYASDRTTELARFQLENREPVSQDLISDYVLKGTVATEDERFYSHAGIDYAGIARALVNNLTGGNLEGASTITQQFVRNTILADEMDDISIKRKVREAYIALEIEHQFTKDQILVMYLNTINYGSGAYGIEAASQRYFSKSATELTLAEAALLVGIPQSPTYNNPIDYPDNALSRRNTVLDRMLTNECITQEEHDAAQAEPIELNVKEYTDDGILAYPYFTSYVRSLLYNSYDLSESDILQGGLKVYTTLDTRMQDAAEAAAAAKRSSLGGDLEVALAVIDPSTGYVKAIVGGSDYYSSEVNLATGQGAGGRPCGSAFKVFTLVEALNQSISPQTLVDCGSPATIDNYTLTNYDNVDYGTRTIARALNVSANTGFVRLISSIGPAKVAETAHKMGISSTLSSFPTLTLGTENVTPLEMTGAYATIASGGIHRDSTPIMTIEDSDGKVVLDNTNVGARSERVLSAEVAAAAEKVMEGVVNSYEGTGTAAALANGQVVAGKTGTTESYKDITFFGITPQLSVGIWCGDPSNVQSIPAGTNCADVFKNFATIALAGQELQSFPTAAEPTYKNYVDQKYHIYGTGSLSSSPRNPGFGTGGAGQNAGTATDGTDAGQGSTGGSTTGGTDTTETGGGSTGTDSGSGGGTGTGGTGESGESGGTGGSGGSGSAASP